MYLTAPILAAPPDLDVPVVCTINGQIQSGGVSPVLWSELARHSVTMREVPGLKVDDDQQALVDLTHANLTSYSGLCRRAIEHRAGAEVVLTAADAIDAIVFGRTVIASAAEFS